MAERSGVGLTGVPRPTEDRVAVLPNAVLVLDGATSPTPMERDGGWYSQVLVEELTAVVRAAPEDDLANLLASAISGVVARYGLVPGDSPSSTVAMVRWSATRVDALVLADSPVIAFGREFEVVADHRLANLRGRVDRMTEWRNRNGGFWVAEANPSAAYEAVRATWPRSMVHTILMATDGISCGVDEYDLFPNWQEVLNMATRNGAESVLDKVRAAEKSDPDRTRWHRTKLHDDQALAIIRLTQGE